MAVRVEKGKSAIDRKRREGYDHRWETAIGDQKTIQHATESANQDGYRDQDRSKSWEEADEVEAHVRAKSHDCANGYVIVTSDDYDRLSAAPHHQDRTVQCDGISIRHRPEIFRC